ncbi:hypothetical protein RIF29_15582 [Crotalaria pallida]|uniref:Uncharacterized protein n=1 Tax=Crotalaria pallida TaxID=3830 RepID=A0AAN9FF27_CROPI
MDKTEDDFILEIPEEDIHQDSNKAEDAWLEGSRSLQDHSVGNKLSAAEDKGKDMEEVLASLNNFQLNHSLEEVAESPVIQSKLEMEKMIPENNNTDDILEEKGKTKKPESGSQESIESPTNSLSQNIETGQNSEKVTSTKEPKRWKRIHKAQPHTTTSKEALLPKRKPSGCGASYDNDVEMLDDSNRKCARNDLAEADDQPRLSQ